MGRKRVSGSGRGQRSPLTTPANTEHTAPGFAQEDTHKYQLSTGRKCCYCNCYRSLLLDFHSMNNQNCFSSVYIPMGASDEAAELDASEIMELGMSRELLNDELYFPAHPSRGWIRSHIITSETGTFRLFLEGKRKTRFLLSAKQFPGDPTFYISTHEDFPELDVPPSSGYVARLEQQRDRSYLLCLNYCHLCDQKFGFFNCGRGAQEREVIAKINHRSRRYFVADIGSRVEYRSVEVTLPAISKSGKRKVWCPRSFRASNPQIGNNTDVYSAIQVDNKMSQIFVSKAPEWNSEIKTLVVRFQGNRILLPSAKNFLLIPKEDLKTINRSDPDNAKQYQQYLQEQVMTGGTPIMSPGSSNFSPHVHPHARKRIPKPQTFYPTQVMVSDVSVVSDSSGPRSLGSEQDETGSLLSRFSAHTTHTTHSAHSHQSEHSDASNGKGASSPNPSTKARLIRADSVGTDGSGGSHHSDSKRAGSRSKEKDMDNNRPREKSNRSDSLTDYDFLGDGNFRAMLQFGKATGTKFVLDFKYPLSPIQAFGIALVVFGAERHNSTASVISDSPDL